jgi:hypothetical protein
VAVEHCHNQSVLHRDLKPANIMLTTIKPDDIFTPARLSVSSQSRLRAKTTGDMSEAAAAAVNALEAATLADAVAAADAADASTADAAAAAADEAAGGGGEVEEGGGQGEAPTSAEAAGAGGGVEEGENDVGALGFREAGIAVAVAARLVSLRVTAPGKMGSRRRRHSYDSNGDLAAAGEVEAGAYTRLNFRST